MNNDRKRGTGTEKCRRGIMRLLPAFLIALCVCGAAPKSAAAASADANKTAASAAVKGTASGKLVKKPKNADKWKKKSGYHYYYGSKGKKVKGLRKIGKKYYLFDSSGRQKTGWQQVKNNYYYFRRVSGKGGYMIRGKTINGIRLNKSGKADESSWNRLYSLCAAQRLVESVTRPDWDKNTKLRRAWEYFQNNYGYYGDPSFSLSGDWGARYAASCFSAGHASCEGLGFAWAFVADACGASECYAVHDGGHGWSEVEGKIYDPSWDRVDRRYSYFGMDKSMSGYNNIPNYAAYGIYRSKV